MGKGPMVNRRRLQYYPFCWRTKRSSATSNQHDQVQCAHLRHLFLLNPHSIVISSLGPMAIYFPHVLNSTVFYTLLLRKIIFLSNPQEPCQNLSLITSLIPNMGTGALRFLIFQFENMWTSHP